MKWLRAWFGVRARLFGLGLGVVGLWIAGVAGASPGTALANGTCNLGNGIRHVVILQFDNVHSERDNPNVPSDLEQMPALRNYITSNGTLLTNDHTILISHTANGIVATETGLYPDRNGLTVSNSYQYFDAERADQRQCRRLGLHLRVQVLDRSREPSPDPPLTPNNTFNNDTAGTGGNTNTPAPWVPSPARAATSPASVRPTWSSRTPRAT